MTKGINLSVNVNKIALLRNSRGSGYPSVVEYSKRCLEYGADGITVHPRPDCRHIIADDVYSIAELIKDWKQQDTNIEFNIEGNPFAAPNDNYLGLLTLVEQVKPDQVTLVPDSDSQLTSDHGFDLFKQAELLIPVIDHCHQQGSRVSLFMDPLPEQLPLIKEISADRIELYTGPYAADVENELLFARYEKTVVKAQNLDIGVNAGHDINLENIERFSRLNGLLEISVGHALTVESLEIGLKQVIANYKKILNSVS